MSAILRSVRTLDLMYFDAGGGHRAAATALQQVIRQLQKPWETRLVHLQDLLAPLDVFKTVTRIDLQEIYNLMLRNGWTLGSETGLRFMQHVIGWQTPKAIRLLAEHWKNTQPDMVVSLVPNFNRAMFEGFQQACPRRPYVTVLTDLADFPPHFWMESQPQYFVCGTPRAVRQAHAMAHPENRVFATSGMILNPRFYDLPPLDRAAERQKLGLDPNKVTGIVLFGGYGTGVMLDILRRLDATGLDLQLILIAGRNEPLREKLASTPTRIPKHVEGFTREVPTFMRLADFFIGKPGPGSLSEALHLGLPAITVRNAWTLPQERYNADWLTENGTGIVLSNFKEIDNAVRRLVQGDELNRMRENTRKQDNRALFEIPEILEHVFSATPEQTCQPGRQPSL